MSDYQWDETFLELFDRCVDRYKGGDENFQAYYSEADLAFLKSIGCKTREFFDFVEDHVDWKGEPSRATALMVASVRRDFLAWEMQGNHSSKEIKPGELPPKPEELAGIPWLPRIIMKARGKLRGELDPDIMFGCGGDRKFLRGHDIAPADFLRAVWGAEEDDQKIVDFVKAAAKR